MADDRNNLVVGYPTREIRVTGERCALMVHTTVTVSRFEIQLVNMSMSSASNMRDAVRKSSDRFKRAMDAFESELRECQRDLDLASKRKRPANRKPSGGTVQRTAQEQANRSDSRQPPTAAAHNSPATQPNTPNAERKEKSKAPAAQNQSPKSTNGQQNADAKQTQKPAKAKQRPDVRPDARSKQQPKASTTEPTPKAEPALPVLN